MVTDDLVSRARAGDGQAFRELAESHRREFGTYLRGRLEPATRPAFTCSP